ncbi:hypothetical protein [Sinomonas terrae]|uniref:Uncharacterized protein n=1 Tax=Sinomonas terrae TaxID=2908838 RepID=A0ABS9U557_9MICC|nr:hypothetical protein [Sinomonas terrae]MCH6471817.1 hypothetical protein [Sinomonas terrae]
MGRGYNAAEARSVIGQQSTAQFENAYHAGPANSSFEKRRETHAGSRQSWHDVAFYSRIRR